jgi:hypothetical protein
MDAEPAVAAAADDSTTAVAPYPPSWLDRWQERLERGPLSPWLVYALIWVVHFALVTVIKWADGSYPVGTVFPYHGVGSAVAVLAVALMHGLDDTAEAALRAFRPLVSPDQVDVARLGYRLTNLRSTPAAVYALAGTGIGAWQLVGIYGDASVLAALKLGTSPLAVVIEMATYLAMWAVLATLVYHTVHQLRAVDHILRCCTEVSLFRVQPVHSFSRLTVRTAVGVGLLPYLLLGASASMTDMRIDWIAAPTALTLVAVLTFVWPLWGVHRLLQQEKLKLQREVATRIEQTVQRIHARVDACDLSDADGLNKTLSSLMLERSMLEKVSTWPWSPEAPRLLATALLLPIALFIAQRVLATTLGI